MHATTCPRLRGGGVERGGKSSGRGTRFFAGGASLPHRGGGRGRKRPPPPPRHRVPQLFQRGRHALDGGGQVGGARQGRGQRGGGAAHSQRGGGGQAGHALCLFFFLACVGGRGAMMVLHDNARGKFAVGKHRRGGADAQTFRFMGGTEPGDGVFFLFFCASAPTPSLLFFSHPARRRRRGGGVCCATLHPRQQEGRAPPPVPPHTEGGCPARIARPFGAFFAPPEATKGGPI